MSNTMGLVLIAALGGCAVAFQGQFMGIMDRNIGTTGSLFINYLSGAVIATVLLLAFKESPIKVWSGVPWYALTAGILGLVIAGSIGYAVPRLGLSTTFTVVVATQFVVAMILDHFGLFGAATKPIDMNRLAGVGTLIISIWLITK